MATSGNSAPSFGRFAFSWYMCRRSAVCGFSPVIIVYVLTPNAQKSTALV